MKRRSGGRSSAIEEGSLALQIVDDPAAGPGKLVAGLVEVSERAPAGDARVGQTRGAEDDVVKAVEEVGRVARVGPAGLKARVAVEKRRRLDRKEASGVGPGRCTGRADSQTPRHRRCGQARDRCPRRARARQGPGACETKGDRRLTSAVKEKPATLHRTHQFLRPVLEPSQSERSPSAWSSHARSSGSVGKRPPLLRA